MIYVERYCKRIYYTDSFEPTLEVLKKLQTAHLLHVPFENLDIHANVPIVLSVEKIFDKIVNRNRGGFCYELNGLFYELLIALGFDAKRISARVYDQEQGYGQEFDHFAILVTIDHQSYLTDVGFGEFAFEPLLFELDTIQEDPRGSFIIEKHDADYLRVSKIANGTRLPEYIFTTQSRELSAYTEMCTYHQTSPDSHFTRKRLITLPNKNGRTTITGNTLKITKNDEIESRVIQSEAEFHNYLKELFQVDL
ncbi:arylamine N-acetyltransferase [Kordia sp. SMS9]|uniref:arylamine N-acetyltransferase family protein n=1 Tax=Kordia sp. SMS9 TaxID=2282170 RepID=UPI000E108976|nr:arylamine N-acetyltransferase [Kordia sp. SMS9]AXG70360.1 arylamine N-acetyltransferase [Kordia sp. SMS9]